MTPRWALWAVSIVVVVALAAASAEGVAGFTASGIAASAFRALSLIGLNLIFGVVGMLAFGQAAFMALPAYASGVLTHFGTPLAIAIPTAFVSVIFLARLLAQIFVRLPGVYLAVGTLGFGMVVEGLARAFPTITGGASGLVFEEGRELTANTWAVISVVTLCAGLAVYSWYARGAVWRRLRAIRHDELAASVLGINVQREKATVFTIGCAYSAAGGLLLFYFVGVLVPEDAGVVRSLEQIGTLLLGGAGYLAGPVLGSFVVDWFFQIAGYTARYETFIYGAIFLLVVMYAPQGLSGLLLRVLPKSSQFAANEIGSFAQVDSFSGGAARAEGALPRLSVREVSQFFGGVQALSGVSFDVRSGEVFTLVGPNGAGKTTMFNIVSGVLIPSKGTILLDETDITQHPVHQRAMTVGRSFQTPRLIPDLTVLANVMLRMDTLLPRLPEAERMGAVLNELRLFELDQLAFRKVNEISLGQRKLIDIVRACVGQPNLVLLDEPAVGLSPDELLHLEQVIAKLRNQRCAVVIVEHNIEFVAKVAERGIVLDSGKPIAHGTVREIMSAENVKAAYFGALS